MADSNPQAWSVADPFDPMDPADQPPHFDQMDDFINFDNLDIDFNIGYSHAGPTTAHDTTQQQQQLPDLNGNLDVQQHMQDAYSPAMPQNHGNGAPHSANQHNISGSSATSFFDFGVPQYSQASTPAYTPAQEHGFRPHSGVPPTPNSVEMHGDPNRYMQQMDPQQAIFDQRYQVRKDDATFTPLVSPAVTPHDGRFQIPEFTVPGAYFSPLTSPALNAQNQQPVPQHTSQYTTSGSSTGTSPVDVDMDILGEPAMAQPEQGRRLRSNRRNAPRSGNTTNRVRQSPVVRPGRRKATVQTLMPHPREVNELVEEARSNRMAANGLEVPGTRDSSETDSISPEPLSEMGPPPKPHSTTQSPAMVAQNQNGFNRGAISQAPATPSSLMRIQPSPNYGVPQDVPPLLDDLTLPEASLDRPQLSRGDTVIYNDDLETPQSSSRKTPKLNPLSTPSGASAMSGKPSPMLGPNSASTPTSPAFSMTGKKTDPKLARNTKKRNSISSNLVSPALRPKISPSIKPLLPEGGVTDNTHALLLASKSNYQNILDGTTVPGIVYPTSLSTNLTSKRTSHKIAEQGRRNRINMALLEMQALLPSPQLGAKDAKSPETSALQSNNSKAAKVESAIEYIKQLKQECSEKDILLDQKDQEVEALRKELAALRRSSSASDTPLKTEPASSPSSANAT